MYLSNEVVSKLETIRDSYSNSVLPAKIGKISTTPRMKQKNNKQTTVLKWPICYNLKNKVQDRIFETIF